MSLPKTIVGIILFTMFCGAIVTQVYDDTVVNIAVQSLQKDMTDSIKNGLNNGLVGVVGVFSGMADMLLLMVMYVLGFMGLSAQLPGEFYIFFAMIAVTFVISIIKLIRGVWDFGG